MEINPNTETLQICRTCTKELINKSLFFNLNFTHANTELTIRQKLYYCIPELDLSIVPNAVICYECADIVNSIYKFKNECLRTEMKIHKYIQQMQQTDSLVDIVKVVQFHCLAYEDLKTELKTEAFEVIENFEADESTLYDSNTNNETRKHTEPTEREYLLSLQKIDLENVPFNTDDNFITYSKSECKEILDTLDGNIAENNIPQVVHKQDDYIHNVDTPDITYQCYRCGYKTESKLKLIEHIRIHTAKIQHHETSSKILLRNNESIKFEPIQRNSSIENNTVKCGNHSYCKRNSKNQCKRICQASNFRNDQDTNSESNVQNHTFKKPLKCLVCEYQCNMKSTLKDHLRIHTHDKSFKCSICEYQFNRKENLKRHMRIHTGEKPFKCFICEYQCSWKSDLKVHMPIHTGEKPFKCTSCEYQCIKKSKLKAHMYNHTGDKPFKCSICEYQFSRKDNLKGHMQIHTGEKPFKCFICEYQFIRKSDLKVHMRIHTGEKPFKCSICEYQCTQKSSLNVHMRIHTGVKPFMCSICEYQFSTKSKLKIHIRSHTGEKPFKCSVCEYQCTQKPSLNVHMQIHTDEKSFKCSICEYQCSMKSNLKVHMRSHTGEKPFKCSICEYQCSQYTSLKLHMRIHTGEKPFQCSMCEYQSSQNGNLKMHMRIHTGEKPFKCPVCEYQCTQKINLKAHMQNKHYYDHTVMVTTGTSGSN